MRKGGSRMPDERIEPVDRAGELRQGEGQTIVTPDVRQLVNQGGVPRFDRPRRRVGRKHYHRPQKARDVRSAVARQFPYIDPLAQSDPIGDRACLVDPTLGCRL